MGIQDIIKNTEGNTPAWDASQENEFIEEEFPVINVYSDLSSDTDSASVFSDDCEYDESPFGEGEEGYNGEDVDVIVIVNVESPSSVTQHTAQDDVERLRLNLTNAPSTPRNTDQNEVEKLQSNLIRKIQNISAKAKSNMGKRKARRFENARQLDLLVGDETVNDLDVDDFMQFNCAFRFSKILEDSDLTNKILDPNVNTNEENPDRRKTPNSNKRKNASNPKGKKITASAAFDNLDSSEKTFFKRRNLPMGMVHYLDSCVFSFFQSEPTGTYISEPLSSYERMILHGIAHYYQLNSCSFNKESQEIRLTKVTNNEEFFNPPCLCLSQYLEQEMNKSINFTKHKRARRNLKRY